MININSEDLLTFAEAASLRPPGRKGRPMHVSTVYRYALAGIRGVRLESVRLGGILYTSRQALQRFADRLTAPSARDLPLPRPATVRPQSDERVAERLDRIGI